MVRAIVGANWETKARVRLPICLPRNWHHHPFSGRKQRRSYDYQQLWPFRTSLLPSGVFYGHTTSIIGNGVALNIPFLVKELESLVSQGVPMPHILVSDRAQILMPYHVLFDTYEEELWAASPSVPPSPVSRRSTLTNTRRSVSRSANCRGRGGSER